MAATMTDPTSEKVTTSDLPTKGEHIEDKELSSNPSLEDDIEHDGVNPVGVPVHGVEMDWGIKNIVTAGFLSALYVGKCHC
jgi:hypothetical protein